MLVMQRSNVMRKLMIGGWVQKRLYDIEWSDDKVCRWCGKEEGMEKRRLHHCLEWKEVRIQRPEELRKWEQSSAHVIGEKDT